ncbi:MAG: hypothetical protein JW814_10960 [Candidatus Krumholzibacteriota bacterium]|nr:hypothetical protein [Candidatus Krumholzibacteriota bacterium]
MNWKSLFFRTVVPVLSLVFVFSCAKKEEAATENKPEGGEEVLSYVSDEVSFGLFFDSEGTSRTIKLKKDQKEFTGYLFVDLPPQTSIAAVQWKLELPEGVELVNDKYRDERIMSIGQIKVGLSERFKPCLEGPKVLIHTLTFLVVADLENATFSILPTQDSKTLGIASCEEGFPEIRASAYKAVVNPGN